MEKKYFALFFVSMLIWMLSDRSAYSKGIGITNENFEGSTITFQVKKGADLFISYPLNLVKFQEINLKSALKDTTIQIKVSSGLPFVILNTNKKTTPYLIFPNKSYECVIFPDQIQLNLHCDDKLKEFESNALNNIQNATAFFVLSSDPKAPKFLYEGATYTKAIDEYLIDLSNKRSELLEAYFRNKNLSDEGHQFLKAYLKFDLIANRLMPLYSQRFSGSELPTWYLDALDQYQYDKKDSIYLRLSSFQRAVIYLNRVKSLIAYKNTSLHAMLKVSEAIPSIPVKDFLAYQIMNMYKSKTDSTYKNLMKSIHFSDESEYLMVSLKAKLNEVYLKESLPSDRFYTLTNTTITFDQIVNEKGTIYYIDFWASWCLPCLKEMSYSRNLKNSFKNKNIKFIYISTDENLQAWKKKSTSLNLTDTYNMPNSDKSKLAYQIKLRAIPRYIIVKDGKILDYNALAPSDSNLSKILQKYVN